MTSTIKQMVNLSLLVFFPILLVFFPIKFLFGANWQLPLWMLRRSSNHWGLRSRDNWVLWKVKAPILVQSALGKYCRQIEQYFHRFQHAAQDQWHFAGSSKCPSTSGNLFKKTTISIIQQIQLCRLIIIFKIS